MTVRKVSLPALIAGLLVAQLCGAGPASAAPYVGPGGVSGATMTLSPTKAVVTRGATTSVKVTVDTKGHAVNAIQLSLTFPDARLDCSSISVGTVWDQSFMPTCTSTAASIVVYTFGEGFSGKALAATVVFRGASTGKALVSVTPASAPVGTVVASNGVDVLGKTTTSTLTVK